MLKSLLLYRKTPFDHVANTLVVAISFSEHLKGSLSTNIKFAGASNSILPAELPITSAAFIVYAAIASLTLIDSCPKIGYPNLSCLKIEAEIENHGLRSIADSHC
jgi:hypothetical protein